MAAATTLTFTSVADTWVNQSAPTKRFGSATKMAVDSSPQQISYVRFSVSGTAGLNITGARLRLHQAAASTTGGRVSRISSTTWSETTTYNTRPAIDGPVLGSFGAVSINQWYELDLGSVTISDGFVSFAIDTTNTNNAKWSTRETAMDPELLVIVDDTPDPEPTGPTLSINDVTITEGDSGTTNATFTATLSEVVDHPVTAAFGTRNGTAIAGSDYTGASPAVTPTVETPAFATGSGDIADDPAIWVNPSDAAQSLVVGTNKGTSGGLAVYNLDGNEVQFVAAGQMNNVDIRTGFSLGEETVDLVVATNRSDDTLAVYKIDGQAPYLENVAARAIPSLPNISGVCLYDDGAGSLYAFVTQESDNNVEQLQLFDNLGQVDAQSVRLISTGLTESEGCVVDDELGHLYLSDEAENGAPAEGIWKYSAAPTADNTKQLIDTLTSAGGHLVADIEGLAIAYGAAGQGHLIASVQGNSTYTVYRRETGNAYVKTFTVAGAGTIDEVSETDGLDVAAVNLGTAFPNGLLVVHDHTNAGGTTSNFKFVPLERVDLGTSSSIEIAPGDTSQTITVPVLGDTIDESDETFFVGLSNVSGASLLDAEGRATIIDDDTSIPGPQMTYTPVIDTYVNNNSPDKSFGDLLNMNADSSPHQISYLRFDVSGLAGQTITGIKLNLRQVDSATAGGRVWSITNDTWGESITYNTRPAIDGPQLGAFGAVAINQWYELDISTLTISDDLVSLAIDTTNTDNSKWATRETSFAPQLVVDVAVSTPTPGATP